MNQSRNLELFDTSLRDGSQLFKDYPTDKQAALMAFLLAKLGIGHIEIGVPAADNQSKERLELIIKAVENSGENPVLYGFCRCIENDINAVLNKMETAKNKGVNIVVSGSELFQIFRDSDLKDKNWDNLTSDEINTMEEKILENIKEQVKYAKRLFNEVRVCFEDGSMGKRDFLVKAIKAAGEGGAGVISIPDTLGGELSNEIKDLFEYLIKETHELHDKGMKFAIHAHNDRGLALANTLSAIKAGATSIEGTLLGSGERVGNTNLKDVIGNTTTLVERIVKGIYFECKGIKSEKLYETYKIIHALLGKQRDPNTPFVGELCTKTQVGIHQSLENKATDELVGFFKKYGRFTPYSVIDISQFGVPELGLNMYTNLSGFSNLEACLYPYGIKLKKNDPLISKILSGLQPDLDNTKVVYSSRVYTEYLIQSCIMNQICGENILICDNNISIKLNFGLDEINFQADFTETDGALGAAVIAINNYLNSDYSINLTDFSLKMQEGEHRIAERYSVLRDIFSKLGLSNGDKQMGIADIEGVFIKNKTNEQIPFITTAHDLHGNHANIKALLYGCLPLIYEKYSKEKS